MAERQRSSLPKISASRVERALNQFGCNSPITFCQDVKINIPMTDMIKMASL